MKSDIKSGEQKEEYIMKVYTLNEVAEVLRLSPQTIRKYVKEGLITAVNKPGKVLITEDNLRLFLNGGVSND